jgi:hypothetical protein
MIKFFPVKILVFDSCEKITTRVLCANRQIIHLSLLIALLLTLTPCNVIAQNKFMITNSNNLNKVLGSGVLIDNIETPTGNAMIFKRDTTKLGVNGETGLYLVQEESSLREALGISAGISARNISYNVEASFGLNNESSKSSNSVTLLLKVAEFYDQIDVNESSVQFTKPAQAVMGTSKFRSMFGNYYVKSIQTGSMVAVSINIQLNSEAQKSSVLASFSGSVSSGTFSASAYATVSKSLEKLSSSTSINFSSKY